MPYKESKISINNPALDRRVKMQPEDKQNVKRLYFVDHLGIREIARIYQKQCSRRTIQFILFPERVKRVVDLHDWRRYYTKETNAKYQRTHRRYKHKLFINGLLKPKEAKNG